MTPHVCAGLEEIGMYTHFCELPKKLGTNTSKLKPKPSDEVLTCLKAEWLSWVVYICTSGLSLPIRLGRSWAVLGPDLGGLGGILGVHCAVLEAAKGLLDCIGNEKRQPYQTCFLVGCLLCHLGRSLGGLLGASWVIFGSPWSFLGSLEAAFELKFATSIFPL